MWMIFHRSVDLPRKKMSQENMAVVLEVNASNFHRFFPHPVRGEKQKTILKLREITDLFWQSDVVAAVFCRCFLAAAEYRHLV